MTLDEMNEFAGSLKKDDVKYPSNLTDYFGKRTEFTTLAELVSFLVVEYSFWSVALSEVSNQNNGHLSRIKNETLVNIDRFLQGAKQAVSGYKDQALISQLQNLYRNQVQSLGNNWIENENPAVGKILSLNEKHNYTVVDTFLTILKHPNQNHSIQNHNQMIAFFEFYKFKGYDTDGLFDFAQSTESSIESIRQKLSESSNQLFDTIHSKHEFIDKWREDQVTQFEQLQTQQKDEDKIRVEKQFNQFDESMSYWQQRVADLEAEYKENLRFKGPAQYWKDSATNFKRQGILWGLLLIAVLIFGLMEFSSFFQLWLKGKELDIELNTMQGAAMFLTIVSAFAFFVSVLAKMTLSSFHLQRDAEEREQLTHLYLSLSSDTDVDPEARKIVLQSLFSRADTGLLGKDAGTPAMPFIGEIFRKN